MRVILVGFMASGKTTIGKLLANKLKLGFVDIDKEIEINQDRSIVEIFEKFGEDYFRKLETEELIRACTKEDIIISTGGGVITTYKNCDILKKQECVVFLDANVETIIKHTLNEKDKRPLLRGSKDLTKRIDSMLEQRYDKYLSVSDKVININNKNIEEVVKQILVYIG